MKKIRKLIAIRNFLLLTIAILTSTCTLSAQEFRLESPDEKLAMIISIENDISFSVEYKNAEVLKATRIAMELDGGRLLGEAPRLRKKKMISVNEIINVQIPNKDAIIDGKYNQLTLNFGGPYQLVFRVYDDGIAYRFIDQNTSTSEVVDEDMDLLFPENTSSYFPQEESMYSHNERLYLKKTISEIKKWGFLQFTGDV